MAILFWPWASDPAVLATLLGLLAGSASDSVVLLPAGDYSRWLAGQVDRAGRAQVLDRAGRAGQVDRPARTRLTILDCAAQSGFAATLNDALRASGKADLVVVADACVLPEGWLAALRRAACVDDAVAGASPLLSGLGKAQFEGIESMPERESPGAGEADGLESMPEREPPGVAKPRLSACRFIRASPRSGRTAPICAGRPSSWPDPLTITSRTPPRCLRTSPPRHCAAGSCAPSPTICA